MIVTYVGYKLAMSPYGIQFSDDEDKLTMETLEISLCFTKIQKVRSA